MPLLGQLALCLALLLGVWGVATGWAGARLDRTDLQESARRATVALAGALFAALVALALAAWRLDFQLVYVAAHADRTLQPNDAWVVLLDGPTGRLLLTGCGLAAGLAVARHASAALDRRALAYAVAIGSAAMTVLVTALLIAGQPFKLQGYTQVDGQGLSQRLHDLDARLVIALRCVAYPAAVIVAVWLAGGTLARHRSAEWTRLARVWALIAWVLISAELGLSLWLALRDGEGAWSAVGRPALLCWVVLTAGLHLRRGSVGVAAHIAHAGAVLVIGGLVATAFETKAVVRLRPGESAPVAGYGVTYLASSVYPARNQIITQGLLELRRGPAERPLDRVAVVRRQQLDAFGRERFAPALRTGSWNGMTASVHIGWVADSAAGGAADFRVAVVPYAPWLWLGCWLLGVGGLAALWPGRERT